MVRAKFTLNNVTSHANTTAKTLSFYPVYDTSTEENKRFSKATPSGELKMYVDNPPAAEFFEIGKTYYLDFTKAE